MFRQRSFHWKKIKLGKREKKRKEDQQIFSSSRFKLYKKWMKIAEECLKLYNYNSVFEILSGLHSVSVWRLQKTRSQFNSKRRYRNLENDLNELISRKVRKQTKKKIVLFCFVNVLFYINRATMQNIENCFKPIRFQSNRPYHSLARLLLIYHFLMR